MSTSADDFIALHGEAEASQAAQHALWRLGDLSWLLHDGTGPEHRAECRALGLMDGTAPEDGSGRGQTQLDAQIQLAYEREVRRFVGCIGRRWGKSFYLVLRAMQRSMAKAGSRIPYAASTGKSLEEFIFPIARYIIATAPVDIRPELVDGEIRFPNGSRIPMQGCEDKAKADRLRGPAADEAIVDEAGFINELEYVVDSVFKYQLGTTDGMMLVFSSPPESPSHYFTKLATSAQRAGAYAEATIYDGPMLTPRGLVKLCNPDGGSLTDLAACEAATSWQREALARYVVDSTRAIVPEFIAALNDTQNPIVCEVPRPTHYHAYSVGDLGYVDLTVILFAYYHFMRAEIVIEDELVLERPTSDMIQRGVERAEAALWREGLVGKPARTVDATPITRADMASAGATGDLDWSAANKVDKDASVNALRQAVQRRKIRIHPRCTTLIAHMRNGIWNNRRTDFERSEGLGHFDAIDAARYLIRAVDLGLNPFPPEHYNKYEQRVPDELLNPKTSWQQAFAMQKKKR